LLDGVDDFIELGDRDNVNGDVASTDDSQKTYIYFEMLDRMTLTVWIYPTDVSGTRVIASNANDANYTLALRDDIPGETGSRVVFQLYLQDITNQWRGAYSSVTIPLNKWTHIAAVYDKDATDGKPIKIIVNGQDVTANTGTAEYAQPATAAQILPGSTVGRKTRFVIGSVPAGGSYFAGRIDELNLFTTAKTQSEIKTLLGDTDTPPVMISAIAYDRGGNDGIEANDTIVIKFSGPTNGAVINSSNIDAVLSLNNGHSWLDGSGGIGNAEWTTLNYLFDTLIITLSNTNGAPTVEPSDIITVNSGVITDLSGDVVNDTQVIGGTFDPLPSGTVGYWNFVEGIDEDAFDSTSIENHGTLINGPIWTAGQMDNALSFDGIDDYVEVPYDASLDLTNQGTFEVWAKKDTDKSLQVYLSNQGHSSFSKDYELADENGYVVVRWGVGVWTYTLKSINKVPTGIWNHIVMTYDGSEIKLFINGQLENSKSYNTSTNPWGIYPLIIGSRPGGGGYFDGDMDLIAVYNRALTPQEVWARYGATVSLESATASDASGGGAGIQAGDQIVIRFNGPTAGTVIDATNIDTALALNNGHTWLDGSGTIGNTVWSTTTYTNDTLIITLSTNTSTPTVAIGDSITLDGTIKDIANNAINGSIIIAGTFGVDVPSGAVAYWKFDEGSGSTANDSAGANNGIVYGATWTTGKSGSALSFDGVDDYITIPDNNDLDFGTGDFSVEMWLKYPSQVGGTDNYCLIMGKNTITSPMPGINIFLDYPSTGKIRFRVDANNYVDSVSSGLDDNTWRHFVFIRNGTTLEMYINGVLDNLSTIESVDVSNTVDLRIGANPNYSNRQNYEGIVDEVVIYNRALSASEVLNRYNLYDP
jgi:hypothetical protein